MQGPGEQQEAEHPVHQRLVEVEIPYPLAHQPGETELGEQCVQTHDGERCAQRDHHQANGLR